MSGFLEPGTIHLAFSHSFYDPVSGEFIHDLHGREAIVTRHPMKMPSDVQKVRIVFDPRLAHLKDVVVFSTRGQQFLCGMLQGGDLDGDDYIIIWDIRIVGEFRNAPVPRSNTPHEEFGIVKDERSLRNVLIGDDPVTNFLFEGFKARLVRVPLGRVSNLIKSVAYQKGAGAYRSTGVLKLLDLHNYLIDADKNGYRFGDDGLDSYLVKLASSGLIQDARPPKPEYEKAMSAGIEVETVNASRQWSHPNDVVFFDYVRPQIVNILQQLASFVEKSRSFSDQKLQKIYNEFNDSIDPAIHGEMPYLKSALNDLRRLWNSSFSSRRKGTPVGVVISQMQAKYSEIKPADPDLARTWTASRFSQEPSLWALLKASTLYTLYHQEKRTSMIWQLAGPELAYIKAHDSKHRIVVEKLWSVLKPRKRRVKLIFEPDEAGKRGEDGSAFDDDSFISAHEDIEDDA
jgi:hypothetical protein